jgi:filamentous hemagglutinin
MKFPGINTSMSNKVGPELDGPGKPSKSESLATNAGTELPPRRSTFSRLAGSLPRVKIGTLASNPQVAATPAKSGATAAGHSESFARLGNGHIAKLTSPREAEMYREFGVALRGVIPDTVPLDQAVGLPGVTPEQAQALDQLRAKAAAGSQQVVVMQALGADIPKADKRELDIKIGASTASRTELIDSGKTPFEAMKKKAKLTAADLVRGSRSLVGENRGFTLAGRTEGGAPLDKSRNAAGRLSESRIREMLQGPPEYRRQVAQHLLGQLENIQAKLRELPVTFVASSVLISIDQRNPQNSLARLIDLAHPVRPDTGSTDFAKLNAQFEHGLDNLIALVRQSAMPTSR